MTETMMERDGRHHHARRKLTIADLKPRGMAAKAEPTPLKLVPPEPVPPPPRVKTPAQKARSRRKAAKWLAKRLAPVRDVVQRLRAELPERFPLVFTTPPRPLAKGIHRDLIAATGHEPVVVGVALSRWTTRLSYLDAVAAGGPRYALDGTEQGEVTDEERAIAARAVALPAGKKKRPATPRPIPVN